MKKKNTKMLTIVLALMMIFAMAPQAAFAKSATNDPKLSKEYYVSSVRATSAWKYVKNSDTVRIAVLDTGVDMNHSDLQEVINKDLSVDVTKNGYPKVTKDLSYHGTSVTGIIGATSNNKKGITGIASGNNNNIEIMDINVFTKNSDGKVYTTTSNVIKGIEYAVDNGAKVINMSLGFQKSNTRLKEACDEAYAAGVTIVCAAGNYSSTSKFYPADYDSTISVIAVDSKNKKASFSNYGDEDIAAPGVKVLSTSPNNKYAYFSGTSMAAPIVTGTAALMYAVDDDLTPARVERLLEKSAKKVSSSKKYSKTTANGVVDTKKAVYLANKYK